MDALGALGANRALCSNSTLNTSSTLDTLGPLLALGTSDTNLALSALVALDALRSLGTLGALGTNRALCSNSALHTGSALGALLALGPSDTNVALGASGASFALGALRTLRTLRPLSTRRAHPLDALAPAREARPPPALARATAPRQGRCPRPRPVTAEAAERKDPADDDGTAADEAAVQASGSEKISANQVAELRQIAKEADAEDAFCVYAKIDSLEDLLATDFQKAKGVLEAKRKQASQSRSSK